MSATAKSAVVSGSTIQREWPRPLTPREWDERFPGLMDPVLSLGGAANIIMQLAHPAVGHGVKESRVLDGAITHRPYKRARTTFTYLAVALMGTTEEKLAYRKAVSRQHAKVYSTEESPVEYNALNPELQMWVAACLYWGMDDLFRRMHGNVTEEQADELYRLAQPLATTLQVPPDMWPRDRQAFEAYWQEAVQKLHIDDSVREFLDYIVDLQFVSPLLRLPLRRFHRFVTTGMLPPDFREEMHMNWSAKQEKRFERMLSFLSTISRFTPRSIRLLPAEMLLRDYRKRLRTGKPLV